MKHFQVISQWYPRSGNRNWGFVPFSIWSTDDYFGFTLINFCFEWKRKSAQLA